MKEVSHERRASIMEAQNREMQRYAEEISSRPRAEEEERVRNGLTVSGKGGTFRCDDNTLKLWRWLHMT